MNDAAGQIIFLSGRIIYFSEMIFHYCLKFKKI